MNAIGSATDVSRLQPQAEVVGTKSGEEKENKPEASPSTIVHLRGTQITEDDGYGHLSDKKHGRWSPDPGDVMRI